MPRPRCGAIRGRAAKSIEGYNLASFIDTDCKKMRGSIGISYPVVNPFNLLSLQYCVDRYIFSGIHPAFFASTVGGCDALFSPGLTTTVHVIPAASVIPSGTLSI